MEEFLAELDLDPQSNDELRELLTDRGHLTNMDELCDGPFRLKRSFELEHAFR